MSSVFFLFLFPFPFRSRESTRRAARERRWMRQSERLSLWIWIRNKFEARPRGEPRAAPKKPIGQSLASRAFPPWPPRSSFSTRHGAKGGEWDSSCRVAKKKGTTRDRDVTVFPRRRDCYIVHINRVIKRVYTGGRSSLCATHESREEASV